MTETTRDTIALRGAGVITIHQPKKGHRFTLDSILLADFCRIKPKDRVLEPGAGTGIISLLLAKKHPRSLFYSVEVQDDLFDLCKKNCIGNDLGNVTCEHRDIRAIHRTPSARLFDVIVANPPYIKEGAGRASPHPGRRTSRHEESGDIASWLDLQKLLKHRGSYHLVFSASRSAELMDLLCERGIEPKRIRYVHPRDDKPASLVMIEAVKSAGRGLTILPPLFVHRPDGSYTDEMRSLYDMP